MYEYILLINKSNEIFYICMQSFFEAIYGTRSDL